MNMYRKNALNQLKSTFEQFLEEYKDEISPQEAFELAKEYEIEIWKDHMERYKGDSDEIGFDIKNSIKMCKTMIKELSKINRKDINNK